MLRAHDAWIRLDHVRVGMSRDSAPLIQISFRTS